MSGTALTQEQNERIQEAEKNLRRMQERIAPFIRRRKAKLYSTAGKWYETSTWLELYGRGDKKPT